MRVTEMGMLQCMSGVGASWWDRIRNECVRETLAHVVRQGEEDLLRAFLGLIDPSWEEDRYPW